VKPAIVRTGLGGGLRVVTGTLAGGLVVVLVNSGCVHTPALVRHRRQWFRWFELADVDENALAPLTFDFDAKNSDIAVATVNEGVAEQHTVRQHRA
jgi:hypothetical protein